MSDVYKGNRSQPYQNQGNSTHEASAIKKRSTKVERHNSSPNQVHVEACRVNLAIFHSA
jgi:hypothetical protein